MGTREEEIEEQITDPRVTAITEAIEDDDVHRLKQLQFSLHDCKTMRFEYQMNVLQLICHEESIFALDYVTKVILANEPSLRKELAEYRDAHLGS